MPIKLAAHKNTLAQRRAKRVRQEIKDCADYAMRNLNGRLQGYAVIVWSDAKESRAFWDGTGAGGYVEDHVNTILRREVGMRDARAMMEPDEDA